jgi:hypothetical protein
MQLLVKSVHCCKRGIFWPVTFRLLRGNNWAFGVLTTLEASTSTSFTWNAFQISLSHSFLQSHLLWTTTTRCSRDLTFQY